MITSFIGKYRFLSNFYLVEVTFEGQLYPTVEHAYQAAKFLDQLLREKFKHPELRKKLLDTDQELQEGNTWGDTEWGVVNVRGNNKLGKVLMKVRAEIKDERCQTKPHLKPLPVYKRHYY